MSAWFVYELDDIQWDKVGETDDHIVPQPAVERGDEFLGQCGSREKARDRVVSSVRKNEPSKSFSVRIQDTEGTCCPRVKDIKSPMLEKDSWSSTPDGVFLDSAHTNHIQEIASFTCNDTKIPNNCSRSNNMSSSGNELCENIIFGNSGAASDSSLCRFQLGKMSPTGNDLKFFDNEDVDKDFTNLSYYGWPDIGNFEEVDRMFRSCDTTFGEGNPSYGNEVPWFSSSSCAIDGSEDALKSSFNSPLSELKRTKEQSERNLNFMYNSLTPLGTNFDNQNGFDTSSMNLQTLDNSFTQGHSYHSLLDADIEDRMVSISNQQAQGLNSGIEINISPVTQTSSGSSEMMNLLRKSNDGRQPEGEREDQCLEYYNDGSGARQQLEYASFYALNHALPMEISSNSTPKCPAMMLEERIEKVHPYQQMQATLATVSEHEDSVVKQAQAALTDLVPVNKQLHQGHDGVGHSEVEQISVELRAEMDSSNMQERSCVSTLLDDVALEEASSFRHLQCIMKQLDIRTKLCIRDSLYRLARSAEQRNNIGNSNSSGKDSRDEWGLLTTEEANVSSRFMDLEADTNPIDRSVAHLLFQSPSDPSTRPSHDSSSLACSSMIHGSIINQHSMLQEVLYMEEISGGAQEVAEY